MTAEIDTLNRQCYDARADYWDRFPFPEHFPPFLWQNYTSKLGNQVLDIGSGTGQVALYLQEAGFDVTCLDPSSEMIHRCRSKGLKTVQTTFQAYDTQEKFGLVVAILSLIHVPKQEFPAQVEKITSILEPNGLFMLGLLKGDTEKIEEQKSGYPRFFARYSPEEVRAKLGGHFTEKAYHERGDYMLFLFAKNH